MEKITAAGHKANFVILNKNKPKIYSNSLSLFLFGQSCCGLELWGTDDHYHNLKITIKNSPKHCDVLIISGAITNKAIPYLRKIYEAIPFPKWVVSLGACANFGGVCSSYSLTKGADLIIPVDIQVTGCPPEINTLFEVFKYLTTD